MFYQIAFALCLFVFWKWCSKKPDYEPPLLSGRLPIVGHGLMFIGDSINSYINITKISEECNNKGGIVSGFFGFHKAYFVTDPEIVMTISNTCLQKDFVYHFADAFIEKGLITADVITWKRHRKLLNPAFSQPVINSFIGCFNSSARSLVNQLASQLDKTFEHEGLLRQNNLESICLTSTGMGGEEYNKLQRDYLSFVPKIQMIFYERFQRFWLYCDFIYNMSMLKRKQDDILKKIVFLSKSIIEKKKAELNNNYERSSGKKSSKLKPFLELILNISNESQCLTDEEIRQETDSIIAAGHETTATVLNLALILLGSYPDVQIKVFEEILEVIGPKRDLDKDDLSKLVYTEAVLKETLRLYPIVPVVGRLIDKDVNLERYTLKANSSCFLSFYGLNRHPVWGPDADKFRPGRWLDTTLPNMNNFGSFSLGRRNCIGKSYAMISMKTTLAHVIREYKVTADVSKLVLKWHMLTYPAYGHLYILERRQN